MIILFLLIDFLGMGRWRVIKFPAQFFTAKFFDTIYWIGALLWSFKPLSPLNPLGYNKKISYMQAYMKFWITPFCSNKTSRILNFWKYAFLRFISVFGVRSCFLEVSPSFLQVFNGFRHYNDLRPFSNDLRKRIIYGGFHQSWMVPGPKRANFYT